MQAKELTGDWKTIRSKGIGGSDIAAICGLSPWKSAYQVYCEKLGADGQERKPEMSYGLMVEPVLRQWYADSTGRTVIVPPVLVHPKYDFVLGSLDGIADSERVVEIKTARSSQDWGEPGTDEIPTYYMTQVQWYMAVTGLPVADVPVSFAGTMPEIYEVPADNEIQEMLIDCAADFWKLVQNRIPPEPVNLSDAIARYGSNSVTNSVAATAETEAALLRVKEIREQVEALETEEDKLKAMAMIELGESDTLVGLDGKVLCTWKMPKAGVKFDQQRFERDHGDLYLEYLVPKPGSRRFLIK